MKCLLALACCLGLAIPLPALAQMGRFNVIGGMPAADFRLLDRGGHPVALSAYKGKAVLVNFWATWCIPCRREMPALERLWREMKSSGLVVIAIDAGEDGATIDRFVRRIEPSPSFAIVLDRDLAVTKAWGVKGMPTSFIIDTKGRIVFQAMGAVEFDSAETKAILRGILFKAGQVHLTPSVSIDRPTLADG
ncbi:MAG: TlpA family protein disulfide reductase [Sulfuritalea sp.]|nr:TlpA family protein disulfide reductase [Sulfuritalea sp.]